MTTDDAPFDQTAAVGAIGRLAITFSVFEGQLHFLAWCVIDSHKAKAGQRITEGMSANDLANLLSRLAPLTTVEERIVDLVGKFRSAMSTRNTALHGLPVNAEQVHNLRDFLKTGRAENAKPPISIEQAETAAHNCSEASKQVVELLGELWEVQEARDAHP